MGQIQCRANIFITFEIFNFHCDFNSDYFVSQNFLLYAFFFTYLYDAHFGIVHKNGEVFPQYGLNKKVIMYTNYIYYLKPDSVLIHTTCNSHTGKFMSQLMENRQHQKL